MKTFLKELKGYGIEILFTCGLIVLYALICWGLSL